MAKAEIFSGICGFHTTVHAVADAEGKVHLKIESECKSVRKMAQVLTEVDPYREFTNRGEGPLTRQVAIQCLPHSACPVPSGIIKAIEVEAGLALPADATIKVSKSEDPE